MTLAIAEGSSETLGVEPIPMQPELKRRLMFALRKRRAGKDRTDRKLGDEFIFAPFETVQSTMDVAQTIADDRGVRAKFGFLVPKDVPCALEYDYSGTPIIVVARSQSAGRGRLSRSWLSEPDVGLYVTYLFETPHGVERYLGFSLAAGVGLYRTISRFGISAKLKWPNDVWSVDTGGEPLGKLGGVLLESKLLRSGATRITLGIGVNLLPLRGTVDFPRSSIAEVLRGEVEYSEIFADLSREILHVWEEFNGGGLAPFLTEWEGASLLQGRKVIGVHRGGEVSGVVRGITESGGLVLERASGERLVLLSDEVTIAQF